MYRIKNECDMDLVKILEKHLVFLQTNEKEGEKANLTRADLTGANLTRANLYGANLTGANLIGADLTRADLTRADLTGAEGIYMFGPMPSSGRIIYAVHHDDGFMIKSGCFWGNLSALKKAVTEKHNCPVYLGVIELLEKIQNNDEA